MQAKHENDAVRPTDRAPLIAAIPVSFDSMEAAQAAIHAIWLRESDRLLRSAYRLVHRIEGADPEGIVSDALIWTLEYWQGITDAEHCRRRLQARVTNICRDIIKCRKLTVDVTDTLPAHDVSVPRAVDSTVAWLLDHCANAQERYIIELYLKPGNSTYDACSEATRSTTGKWLKHSWTPKQVRDLFTRLRDKVEVSLTAEARRMLRQPMTKGTEPGLHCERHKTLGSVVLLASGGRPVSDVELLSQRHVVPALRMDDTGRWLQVSEVVMCTA